MSAGSRIRYFLKGGQRAKVIRAIDIFMNLGNLQLATITNCGGTLLIRLLETFGRDRLLNPLISACTAAFLSDNRKEEDLLRHSDYCQKTN